jgi:hypothetical protein
MKVYHTQDLSILSSPFRWARIRLSSTAAIWLLGLYVRCLFNYPYHVEGAGVEEFFAKRVLLIEPIVGTIVRFSGTDCRKSQFCAGIALKRQRLVVPSTVYLEPYSPRSLRTALNGLALSLDRSSAIAMSIRSSLTCLSFNISLRKTSCYFFGSILNELPAIRVRFRVVLDRRRSCVLRHRDAWYKWLTSQELITLPNLLTSGV